VAAVDERRHQRQQVNNQRSRVIKKSEFTEKSDRSSIKKRSMMKICSDRNKVICHELVI
jgi:hypothetical protein